MLTTDAAAPFFSRVEKLSFRLPLWSHFRKKPRAISLSCFSAAWVNFNGIQLQTGTIVDIKNVKNNSDIDSEGHCAYHIINTGNNR